MRTNGEHVSPWQLAATCWPIPYPLHSLRQVVRGLWIGLTEKERWEVACRTVDHLKEHGDKWKLNEELESPVVEAHSTPSSFTEAHNQK